MLAVVCPLQLRRIRRQQRSLQPTQRSPVPARQAGKLDLATARFDLPLPLCRQRAAMAPAPFPPFLHPPHHRRLLLAAPGPPCRCALVLAPQQGCPLRRPALRLRRCRRRTSPGRARGLRSARFCRRSARRCPLQQGHRLPGEKETRVWGEARVDPHGPERAALRLIMAPAVLRPGGVPRLTAARLHPEPPPRVLRQAGRAAGSLAACERRRSGLLGWLLAGQTVLLGLRAQQVRRLVAMAAGQPLCMPWWRRVLRGQRLRPRPLPQRLSHGPLSTWRLRWRRCSWLRGRATWTRARRRPRSTPWPSHTPRLRPTRCLQARGQGPPAAASRLARGPGAAAAPKDLSWRPRPLVQALQAAPAAHQQQPAGGAPGRRQAVARQQPAAAAAACGQDRGQRVRCCRDHHPPLPPPPPLPRPRVWPRTRLLHRWAPPRLAFLRPPSAPRSPPLRRTQPTSSLARGLLLLRVAHPAPAPPQAMTRWQRCCCTRQLRRWWGMRPCPRTRDTPRTCLAAPPARAAACTAHNMPPRRRCRRRTSMTLSHSHNSSTATGRSHTEAAVCCLTTPRPPQQGAASGPPPLPTLSRTVQCRGSSTTGREAQS